MFIPLGKTFVFWFSILTLTAMLQRLLPINDYSWTINYALSTVATLTFFHGSCATMYKLSCWVLKKWCPNEMEGFSAQDFAMRSCDSAVYRRHPDVSFTCRLRWSTQHWPGVYSREFRSLRFFWGVDSSAARPGRVALGNGQTGQFS
jgi:hypothetical protein